METITSPTKTKANKEHKCEFCLYPIFKGTDYLRSTHKFEGIIYTWKAHENCSELVSKLDMYDSEDGVNSEVFRECVDAEYYKLNQDLMEDGFIAPIFIKRLEFIFNHYKI